MIFGVTGHLVHKMIFPALYAMAKRGVLNVPVVGVAAPQWSLAQLRKRAPDSIRQAGKINDRNALDRLLSQLRYVGGNYNDLGPFKALKQVLGDARRPAHGLAIPPALFATVIEGLGAAGLADQGRLIVEKPFGRDLASARELNRIARSVFLEASIFRIDHYLGKEAIMNILYFRFANSFLKPIWNRNDLASVQITLCEDFGFKGRGAFYESAGCLRDVIQNHLFQVVAQLRHWGATVILSDSDVVFQPRKVQRSGLWEAVEGRVLIYLHKEHMLADIEQRYPASHYVMVDDKMRNLTAMKQVWGNRLTTVFPRQGHYALAPRQTAAHPPADFTIERIGELGNGGFPARLGNPEAGRTR